MKTDEALRRVRTNDTTLTTLDLVSMEVGERLGALEWNTTPRTLKLGYNRLGEGGGVAVAGALERNTTLTTLKLGYNRLGEGGGAAVAGALERNTTLATLNLGYNGLGEDFGVTVADALEKNTTLTTLILSGNGVHVDTMERVRMLLSGREVPAGSADVEVVSVKAALAAPPRGTKRDAPG